MSNTTGSIEILNMTGQSIYTTQVKGISTNIDVSRFVNGMYLLKYSNTGKLEVIKFIKQ